MSDTTLSLGPVVFRDFEIPATITLGGRQRMAVHYLSTGRRTTDVLGPDDATISFAGVLSGPTAAARVREIDLLRKLGQPLPLAWNTFGYSVLLSSFQVKYKNQSWIPYKISCWIIDDAGLLDLISVLPATDLALASIVSMYRDIPASLLPISDARLAIASCVPGSSPAARAAVSSSLAASAMKLKTEQRRRDVTVEIFKTDGFTPLNQFIVDFSSITQAAEDCQFLVQAQDCIGQAAAYLRQDF